MSKGLAVITGASSGLGAEFARHLAARGYDLLLVARRMERLTELATTLERHEVHAEALAVDLANEAQLAALAERLAGEEVELLVNNAGFGAVGRFFDGKYTAQEQMVRVHVDAPMLLTRAVLPRMVERNRGAIINVSSVAAFVAMAGNTIYSATKAFLLMFTEGLAQDLASGRSEVRTQALCPGFTHTEFHADMPETVRTIPRLAWMSATDVVSASLRGLDRDQVVVIPGLKNKLLVAFLRLVPAGALRLFNRSQSRRRMRPRRRPRSRA